MALQECLDCGSPVSTEAYVCPQCGRPTPKHAAEQAKVKRRLFYWLFGLFALITAYQVWALRR